MSQDAETKYADMIHLPHPVSKRHPQMSMADRAAQFSPFAALNGHDAAIAEAARITTERPILDESVKVEISNLLQAAVGQPQTELNITSFVPDARKAGGRYIEISGSIRKLIPHEKQVVIQDGTRIPIENIIAIKEL